MTVAREDLALEAAFWAQLPGNFADASPQGADHFAQLRRAWCRFTITRQDAPRGITGATR